MCSLCGVLGADDHWSDAVTRPGVFSRNGERASRRAERTRRIKAVNEVLQAYRLSLSDWQGTSYLLSTATGKTEVIDSLAHLWPSAEKLSGRLFDPLDPALPAADAAGPMTAPQFTPVHLLTGFLGSGKTTLLRRILKDPLLAGAAVLINEFGEVGLDHELIERIDENVVLLQSGCLCCTIRGELASAIKDLLSKRERGLVPAFDRLIIESTGLADPFPILSTIRGDTVIRHHFSVAGTITTVDAVNATRGFDHYPEMRKQIASADRILLTKTDLVSADAATSLLRILAAMNPAAEVRDARSTGWDSSWLVADVSVAPGHQPPHDVHHAEHHHDPNRHGETIRAFAIEIERPIDWTMFGVWLTMLLNRHGGKVLRVKAILALAGEERPVAVHGVQHLVHPPTHMASWPSADRRSRLVFILDGIEPELVRQSFETFVFGGDISTRSISHREETFA